MLSNLIKIWIIIIGAWGLQFHTLSQDVQVFHDYRIGEEALKNIDVYSIYHCEKNNVLFVGTNKGIYYWAQNKFNKIPDDNRALSSSYFSITPNSKGELFSKNLNGQIFKINKSKVELIYEVGFDTLSYNFDFKIDLKDDIYCLSNNFIHLSMKNGQVQSEKILYKNTSTVSNFEIDKNGQILFFSNQKKSQPTHLPQYIIGVYPEKVDSLIFYQKVGENHPELNEIHGTNCSFFSLHEKTQLLSLNDSILAIMEQSGGICLISISEKIQEDNPIYYQNEFISTAYLNNSGVLFLGTFKKGIIVIPDLTVKGVKSTDYYKAAGFGNKSYYTIKKNGLVEKHFTNASKSQAIVTYKNGINRLPELTKKSDWFEKGQLKRGLSNLKQIEYLTQYDLLTVDYSSLNVFTTDSKKSLFRKKLSENKSFILIRGRVAVVAVDTVNKFIYYSFPNNGLFKTDYFRKNTVQLNAFNDYHISTLKFQNKHLYIGTKNGEIIILKNTGLQQKIQSIESKPIRKIKCYKNFIFALNDEKILVYDLTRGTWLNFNPAISAMNFDVIDFDVHNEQILILKNQSHFIVDLVFLNQKSLLDFPVIDSIMQSGQKVEFQSTEFDYTQNNFKFYLNYFNFKGGNKHKILYRLEGHNKSFKELDNRINYAEFESLPPGNYTFKTYTITDNGASDINSFTFKIHNPFWKKSWFILGVVLLLILLIIWYTNNRIRKIKLINKQRLDIESNKRIALNAQLKAIRSQMNPHFVFNAINSIQDLILKKETLKSYDYLESFSRLVRLTLEHSEMEFVTISEEISFLELYLELESLRFDNSFQYVIKKHPDIHNEVLIPSLIIQPFIENSIKHGLLNKFGDKTLTITFSIKEESILQCSIEDNGVGRAKSAAIKKRQSTKHKSFSTDAIQNRMKILKEKFGQAEFKIIDLFDENGEPTGTLALINLQSFTKIKP